MNETEKQAFSYLITVYFDGRKTKLAAWVVVLSCVSWVGSYVLQIYSGMDPQLAELVRGILGGVGGISGGLAMLFQRMATDKVIKKEQ